MLTLCLRTDKPEAELYLYDGESFIAEFKWEAHRKLAETIQMKIDELLKQYGYSPQDLEKLCVYQGPGSFTGLRIGLSVANTLAYALNIPISAAEGESWLKEALKNTGSGKAVTPKYGSDPHITKQKK